MFTAIASSYLAEYIIYIYILSYIYLLFNRQKEEQSKKTPKQLYVTQKAQKIVLLPN